MAFELPKLPYAENALEPHIGADTMNVHYNKHHAGYTKKLNAAIAGTDLEGKSIEEILAGASGHSAGVRNNGGGFYNHALFWSVMGPGKGGEPTGDLAEAINSTFGSFTAFKEAFSKASSTRFGSGWGWLVVTADGGLAVTSSPNQDNPLMDVDTVAVKGTPILGLDVWEHAYYLNYQNRRGDYVSSFFDVVDWDAVAARYAAAK